MADVNKIDSLQEIRNLARDIAKLHNIETYFVKVVLWDDGGQQVTLESNVRDPFRYQFRINIPPL